MRKLPLTRLLAGYETAGIEPQEDGSVLVFVESQHPDLLLATFALSAEALDRYDVREFLDRRAKHREDMAERMRLKRADPKFRERERRKSKERMRGVRKAK